MTSRPCINRHDVRLVKCTARSLFVFTSPRVLEARRRLPPSPSMIVTLTSRIAFSPLPSSTALLLYYTALLSRGRDLPSVSLRLYSHPFHVLGINNMFYSHEGKPQSEPPAHSDRTNPRSAHVAQIRCGDRVVCWEGVQSPLPCTDRSARLVSCLGSKSSLKRINRKQILDVDVPKACQTIVDPVAPMALRLQGNLLYVSVPCLLQATGY
jgi:hypothetical protein